MPSASKMHIADLVAEDESRRQSEYERAWKAYDGEGPQSLEVGKDEADDNIRLAFADLIVDKGVSFLVGKDGGVTLQPKPPAGAAPEGEEDNEADPEADEERAAEALDAAWPPQKRQLDFHDLATNGGVCGQVWVRLYDNGRVSVLDPGNCSADWNEDDVSIVERYKVEWSTVDEDGLGILRRWRIEPDEAKAPSSWMIFLEEHDDDHSEWTVIEETSWPHPFAPIITGQNLPSPNTFYGTADLKPSILDQIEQLESVASDMRRILRLHGHPFLWATGVEASAINTIDAAIGGLLVLPDEKAKLGTVAVAELTSALELFRELKAALLEASRIPKVALGETKNAGPTTGVALKVEYQPLVEKTETKYMTYGYVISEIARRVYSLIGLDGWTVMLSWPDPLPSDPKADAEADEAELRMEIVSRQTVAEKRGYDWEVEQQRIAEERQASADVVAKAFREGEVEE